MSRINSKPEKALPKGKEEKIKRMTVEENDPLTLMEFIKSRTGEERRSALKDWLSRGQVAVDGIVTTNVAAPLHAGQRVDLNYTRAFVRFRHPRLRILYEDADIIVVEKGYGLLSVATDPSKKEETAYSILRDYVKSQSPANKVFIIHRLDQATSGVMMFARSAEAKEAMQHNWKNMVLDRRYAAVVEGAPEKEEGVVKSYLGETSAHEMYSSTNPKDGKEAVAPFRVLHKGKFYSLMEYSLDTGRKNQIRIHSKVMGCPIAGDKRYGGHTSPLHRLALHARTLNFVHPVTRRLMQFESPVPGGFYRLAGTSREALAKNENPDRK